LLNSWEDIMERHLNNFASFHLRKTRIPQQRCVSKLYLTIMCWGLSEKMKNQYTKKVFQVIKYKSGIEINLIKRKKKGKPFDVIEVKIFPYKDDPIIFYASPEEALEIAWGLNKTVWQFLNEFEPYRIFRSQKSDSKWSKKRIWWSL